MIKTIHFCSVLMVEILKTGSQAPKRVEREISGVLRMGMDMDGVLVNLSDAAKVLIKQKLGIDIDLIKKQKGSTNYWLHEWPEIQAKAGGREFVLRMFEDPEIYKIAEPMSGAVDVINKWQREGHQIWIVTARPKEALGVVTMEWLGRNKLGWIPEGNVLFRSHPDDDKTEFKSVIAQELDFHAFIEDHAATLSGVNSNSMMVKILVEHSYNLDQDAGCQVKRIRGWQTMDEVIQEASRWHYFLNSSSSAF